MATRKTATKTTAAASKTTAAATAKEMAALDEKKETAKKTTAAKKPAAETKKAAAPKKAAPAKKPAGKKEVVRTSVVQFGEESYKVADIIANAEADYKENNKRKPIDEIKVYIKPEDHKAYYVVKSGKNEILGDVDL